VSRTRDLVDQIKQITIEIRDIKRRSKNKINSAEVSSTISVHNHTLSGPLQVGHEEHDEDDVHYEDSTQSDHQQPGNKYNRTRYVPTQYPTPTVSTSSPPLPPELHPSSSSNGNPVKPVSSTTPWSKKPNDPESPEIVGDNVGGVMGVLLCGVMGVLLCGVMGVLLCGVMGVLLCGVMGVLLCGTNGTTSGDASDVGPGAD